MERVLDTNKILIICSEGKSLGEKNYFKQLNDFIRQCSSNFINFDQIERIVIEINKVLDLKRLETTLKAKLKKQKFSFIAIWKDNDSQTNVQKENERLLLNKSKMFKILKDYLVVDKKFDKYFAIWLLPHGWNFEVYYRNHFLKDLKCSDKELKEKFKDHEHFIKNLFKEEYFRNIHSKLKEVKSNINLFDFN